MIRKGAKAKWLRAFCN